MEPLPLVTCVMIAATLYPPVRYFSIASFLIFFSGTTLLLPPAWHAAQLPVKTLSPFSRSAASAGRPPSTAASSPSARPSATGLQAAVAGAASDAVPAGSLGGARGVAGTTKHTAAHRAAATASSKHTVRAMVRRLVCKGTCPAVEICVALA